MSTLAAVAIVMAIGEGNAPTTVGMVAAVAETFVQGTAIRIAEAPFPSDEAGLDWERELAARAVVTVHWEDEAHLRVHIRLHEALTDRWTDRVLRFAPEDTPVERGRTVGFAVASMWPDAAAVRALTAAGSARDEATPTVERRALAGSPPRRAITASLRVAEGLGGSAEAIGGRLAGAYFLGSTVALRVGVELRAGQIPEAPARSRVGIAALGAEWWPGGRWPTDRFALGLEAELLWLYQRVWSAEAGASTSMPGAYLGPAVAVRLWRGAEASFGVGLEIARRRYDVYVGEDLTYVANIPRFRAVGHSGVRLRF